MRDLFKACVTTQTPDLAEAFFEEAGAVAQAIGVPQDGATRVEAYFNENPALGVLPFAHRDFNLDHVPDQDWVTRSQQNLPPLLVPPFFLFGHHALPRTRRARHHIEMDAGLAFGSGHHATTQGCLHLLAYVLKARRPSHAADIGTGSGTLAIALAKAGCENVFACDNDADAVRVARQNFKINTLPARIKPIWCNGFAHPAARTAGPFELIMANILAAPLVAMAPAIAKHLAPTGQVILSGLLHSQKKRVVARYRHAGLCVQKDIRIGPWTSLMFRR